MIPGGLAWRAWHKGIEEPARERQRQDYITGTQRYVDDFNDDVNRFREEDASKVNEDITSYRNWAVKNLNLNPEEEE
tara:strand:+ start:355 stop:585 length:231 start_codon:yes stop_codon:yes gene_type:complete